MAVTAVDICNMALMRIGSSKQVTDITSTPTTNEMAVCKLQYPICRDFVLHDAPWGFAMKTDVLAGSATGPQGWAYQYTYPSDAIRILKVLGTASPRIDEGQPFRIITNSGGTARLVATNQASASARYTKAITDPSLFDNDFINALAWYLASQIATPLSASQEIVKNCLTSYYDAKSKVVDEGMPDAGITDVSAGAVTLVGIANAALLKVGHKMTISSTTENTNEARLFGIYYPRVRDAVLRAVNWNFASKRATLSTANTAAAAANWSYKFTVPADCLMARFIVGTAIGSPKFEIMHDATAGRTLYTNQASAVLSYTAQVTDMLQFDALFTSALICALAVSLGTAIGADPKLIEAAQSGYNTLVAQGITQNDKEGISGPPGGLLAATPTALKICNMALARLGLSPLADVTDATREARMCGLFYETCQDAVLREVPWNFASKRLTLTENTSATLPDIWGYVYNYPSDCLMLRSIERPGTRLPRHDQRIPFAVAYESISAVDTKLIYCDLEDALAIYTADVGTESIFDSHFEDAVAWRMAMEMAPSLEPKLLNYATLKYRQSIGTAIASNFNESFDGDEPDSELVAVRQ